MNSDEAQPVEMPDPEPGVSNLPPEQVPDQRDLDIERELLQLEGVQSVGLEGDEWVLYLRRGADASIMPDRIGDRLVRSVLAD